MSHKPPVPPNKLRSNSDDNQSVSIKASESKNSAASDYSLELNDQLTNALKSKETELKEIQEQIAHLDRLANLDTMGAAIIHELSTPLTIVTAEAEELLRSVKNKPTNSALISECAENIRGSAMRMHRILEYARDCARQQTQASWTRLNINDPLNSTLILLKPQLVSAGIEVRLTLCEKLPKIWGDANKLESVFQNLIGNTRDAFLQLRDDRSRILRITTATGDDDGVVITIADSAGGIPKRIRPNIFQPFFTTRKAEQGTGLGLAIVNQLVKEHNGDIELTSENGRGSEFTIRFPIERRNIKDAQ